MNTCPKCGKRVLSDESSANPIIEGTTPVEVEHYHFLCYFEDNNEEE